jgi:LacI family transcriptional regulator
MNGNETVAIPADTRERVLSAMRELGYVPNVVARRLRSKKTHTIACVIPDILNPFYPGFERGIQDYTEQQDYDLMIFNTDHREEKERKYIDALLEGSVDGLVGVFFHMGARDLQPLLDRGIHVVRLEATSKPAGEWPLDNIYVDNVLASQHAVTYLIEKGHTRIAILTSVEGPSRFRLEGYRRALQEHNLRLDERLIRTGSFDEQGGYLMMGQLLTLKQRPTAVFASNDLIALGALMAIRESGLSVPHDIAVVGFDDIALARLVFPPLTTISQNHRQIGRRAAELLFERINGTAPETGRSEGMPFELVVRGTA